MYESQRTTLANQQMNMESTRFTVESIQDTVQTVQVRRDAGLGRGGRPGPQRAVCQACLAALLGCSPAAARRRRPPRTLCVPPPPQALKGAAKEMRGTMKAHRELDLNFIDKLQDELADMADLTTEINETLGQSFAVPEDVDEVEGGGEGGRRSGSRLMGPGRGRAVRSWRGPSRH
jgi:hypothetical protein